MLNIFFWRLRVLAFYVLVALFTTLFCISLSIAIYVFRVNSNIRYNFAFIFSYGFILLNKFICNLTYDVEGLAKLPKEPSIVLSNHQSFWDNIIMQILIPRHSWIIKKELFDIPMFGWGLKMSEPVAVDRTNNNSVKQILEEGKKKLDKGLWLIIFPESTRLLPNQTAKFKPSALKLAKIANVPIVLMAHNAGVYWPKGFWIKKPGVIKVKIIEVISQKEIEETDIRVLNDKVEKIINNEKQNLLTEAIAQHVLKSINIIS